MSKLKGWRTVFYNVLMVCVMIIAQFEPDADVPTSEQIDHAASVIDLVITAIWGLGNIGLRFVTDTPIFKGKSS